MKNESTVDKMVDYMNTKYSDHFEYYAPFGGGPGLTSNEIIVKSEKFPDAEIVVAYYVQDGEDVFIDQYIDYKYEQQTRELLQKLLEEAFECDVFLSFGVGGTGAKNNFTDTTTFKEYISSKESYLGFNAIVLKDAKDIDSDIIESRLLAALTEHDIVIGGSVYFANDEATFKPLEELASKDRRSLKCLDFSISNSQKFDYCEWR